MSLADHIEAAVQRAMEQGQIPGAVILIGRGAEVLYHGAMGSRMLIPETRPMEIDTLFDMASVTKPVATATASMQLVEAGEISLRDPVSRFLPQFAGEDRQEATIRHLLTHSSGIPAYKNYLHTFGPEIPASQRRWRVVEDICRLPLEFAPGKGFTYTCLGYILLTSIVEKVSGTTLDRFSSERIFAPLGMADTGFCPSESLLARCAATEPLPEGVLLGVVHDENARYLGGVGGNAGLFSTAADLSRYMQAFLGGGALGEARILSPATIALMTTPQSRVPDGIRSVGWDIDSAYTPQVRGEIAPRDTIGHSGYTGTSIWADAKTGAYTIILTNRVHLGRDKDVSALRREVANIAASELYREPAVRMRYRSHTPVLTGLDVAAAQGFPELAGKRIGLIANHTGIDRERRHLLDLLLQAPEVTVGAILSPEHGFAGLLDEVVPSGEHESGLPIHSLYGETQSPTPQMLQGLDALVYDIADLGVRFYTYTTTMTLCMKAAAEAGIGFVVLDRPNPINAVDIEGPVLDKPYNVLSSWHPVPLRHGLTSGELARWSVGEYGIGCDLSVVQCRGYKRRMWFDDMGLPWINPSPNMRNLKQAILYPAIGTLESTNISVGRGTDTPFELFGAPWMDGDRLARRLNDLEMTGLSFVPIQFTPDTREFAGELCHGVYVMLEDRHLLRPVEAAVRIALVLRELWPDVFKYEKLHHLLGSRAAVEAIGALRSAEEIVAGWDEGIEAYRRKRSGYLLYG